MVCSCSVSWVNVFSLWGAWASIARGLCVAIGPQSDLLDGVLGEHAQASESKQPGRDPAVRLYALRMTSGKTVAGSKSPRPVPAYVQLSGVSAGRYKRVYALSVK